MEIDDRLVRPGADGLGGEGIPGAIPTAKMLRDLICSAVKGPTLQSMLKELLYIMGLVFRDFTDISVDGTFKVSAQVLQHQFDVGVNGGLPSDYPRFGISMIEKV